MGILGFFGPKYNAEQKYKLDGVLKQLKAIGVNHFYNELGHVLSQLNELFLACSDAVRSGLKELPFDHEEQLDLARRLIPEHQASIEQDLELIRGIQLEDWYPDKLKTAHADSLEMLESEMVWLKNPLLAAILPAGPLVNTAVGFPRITMFYNGLNHITRSASGLKIVTDIKISGL